MKNTFKDRILEFLNYLEVGQTKFEEHTGLGRASISKIKDGMSSPNLAKIAKGYPELNIDWLITGKGEMLKETRPASFGYQSVIGDSNTSTMTGGDNIGVPTTKTNSQKRILENESLKLKIDNLESKISLLETALLDKERIIEEKERMIQILLKKG